jgi:hypothetical protein
LDATVILAVSELGRQAMRYGFETEEGKRCAVAGAYLLAMSKKNRFADEFLELVSMAEKHPDDVELKAKMEDLCKIEDYVLDMHTMQGKKMGRGEKFWLETSSLTENRSEVYAKWREWWQLLMLRLVKEE